jgi:uncharacterized protein (TIGR02145 family)
LQDFTHCFQTKGFFMSIAKATLTSVISIALASTFFGCGDVEGSYNLYSGSSSSDDSSSSNIAVSSSSLGSSSSNATGGVSSSSGLSSSSLADAGSSSSSANDGFIGCKDPDETVTIGTQTWLKCNLNVEHNEGNGRSFCYASEESNCDKYGRLYSWAAAMDLPAKCVNVSGSCSDLIEPKHRGLCPQGFHIPTKDEWTVLINYAGGEETAGTKLKAAVDWCYYSITTEREICHPGTDDYGFAALLGGEGDYYSGGYSGGFGCQGIGQFGRWWSASEYSSSEAGYILNGTYAWFIEMAVGAYMRPVGTIGVYSVRCLKD